MINRTPVPTYREAEEAADLKLYDLVKPALDKHPQSLHPDLFFDKYGNPDRDDDPSWPRHVSWSTHAAHTACHIEHGSPRITTTEALVLAGFEEYLMGTDVWMPVGDGSNAKKIIGIRWSRSAEFWYLRPLTEDWSCDDFNARGDTRLECMVNLLMNAWPTHKGPVAF